MEDVNILKAHINALTKNSHKVAKFMKMQTNHFSSFISTTNERLDSIQESVMQNFQVITNLSKAISEQIQQAQSGILKLLGIHYTHMAASHKLLKQYDTLKRAIISLLEGKIPPSLISKSTLEHSFSEIKKILTNEYSNFYLTITDPDFFYNHGQFIFYLRPGKLYITVKYPISHKKEPLQLYKVIVMPLPLNESSNHATQLLNLPQYLAITNHQQFYITFDKDEIASCHKHNIFLCNFNKPLLPVTEKSCIISLFANDKRFVRLQISSKFVAAHCN